MTKTVLYKVEEGMLEFCHKYGMSENKLHAIHDAFDAMKPHVEKLVVITGAFRERDRRNLK